MNQNLISLSHNTLDWQDNLPSDFKGWRLPGSKLLSAIGEFGSVCIQEFQDEHYSMRLNVFDLLEQFIVKTIGHKDGLDSTLILKGEATYEINKAEKFHLLQNHFCVIQAEAKEIITIYKRKLHISFDTLFSKKLKDELSIIFESLKLSKASTLFIPPQRADIEIHDIANSIFRCKYKNNLRRYYFESRVKDLLFKYLAESTTASIEEKEPAEKEVEAVNVAAEIITADLSAHYLIPDLAKKVLLNEFRFKKVFKLLFGVGPYEYLVKKRMEKAKELLNSGLSIKEVAAYVGYRPSDFTTSFRQHFGYPPSLLKKPKQ